MTLLLLAPTIYVVCGIIVSSFFIVFDSRNKGSDLKTDVQEFLILVGLWPLYVFFRLIDVLQWIPTQYVKFLRSIKNKPSKNKDITA